MRGLNSTEITNVVGGELQCTVGTGGASCTGTLTDFADAVFGAYDNAVASTTELFCWIGGVK